jgi:uncharacterized membrane protein
MGLAETMEQVARGVEVVGIATLVLGLVVALVQAARVLIGGQEAEEAYRVVRTVFGRSILLGLEFLVAADIIRTVAVEPSLKRRHQLPQQVGVGLLQVLAQPGQRVHRRCDHRVLLHVFRQEPREDDAVVLLGVGPSGYSGPSYTTPVDANPSAEQTSGRAFQARDHWGHIGATSGPRATGSQRTTAVTIGPPSAQLTEHTRHPAQVAATLVGSLTQKRSQVLRRQAHSSGHATPGHATAAASPASNARQVRS